MLFLRTGLVLATFSIFVAMLPAQTFLVDANNGPGTDYTSIAAAALAVPDGAVLRVLPGDYGPVVIQAKSLAVIGVPGVVVVGALGAAILVQDLGPDQRVAIRQVAWKGTLGGRIQCQNCAGPIVIDSCDGAMTGGFNTGGTLSFMSCDQVFVRETAIEPQGSIVFGGVRSENSNVVLSGCGLVVSGWSVRQVGGRVSLVDCRLRTTVGFALPMVSMSNGTLRVQSGTEFTGSLVVPDRAIAGTGTVILDAGTQFYGGLSPPIDPAITIEHREIPWLRATTQSLGGTANATLSVPPGGLGALWIGASTSPYFANPLADPLWLAPGAIPQAFAAAPTVTSSYSVPITPSVYGLTMTWQGVVLDSACDLAASNPYSYLHH